MDRADGQLRPARHGQTAVPPPEGVGGGAPRCGSGAHRRRAGDTRASPCRRQAPPNAQGRDVTAAKEGACTAEPSPGRDQTPGRRAVCERVATHVGDGRARQSRQQTDGGQGGWGMHGGAWVFACAFVSGGAEGPGRGAREGGGNGCCAPLRSSEKGASAGNGPQRALRGGKNLLRLRACVCACFVALLAGLPDSHGRQRRGNQTAAARAAGGRGAPGHGQPGATTRRPRRAGPPPARAVQSTGTELRSPRGGALPALASGGTKFGRGVKGVLDAWCIRRVRFQ